MYKYNVSETPYYHIHIDGKRKPCEPFADFAKKELGFFEMPFSRIGDSPPVLHLTKKYSRNDLEIVKEHMKILKENAERFNYIGYIECEEIQRRHLFSNDTATGQSKKINKPFVFTNRKLEIKKGEYFKAGDIHLTISKNSDPLVIQAINESGLLRVNPLYNNSIVFTAQFPKEKDFEEKMEKLEKAIIDFLKNNNKRILNCVVKYEKIIDYSIHNATEEDLPLVVNRCKYCPYAGMC